MKKGKDYEFIIEYEIKELEKENRDYEELYSEIIDEKRREGIINRLFVNSKIIEKLKEIKKMYNNQDNYVWEDK